MPFLSKRESTESGFTLIEILVVVLIIGILSAIAVPVFLNQRQKSLDAQLQSDMKTVAAWMETYKVKNPNGEYPRIAKTWYAPSGTTTDYSNWPSDLKLSNATGIITSDSSASQAYFGGNTAPVGAGFCIEGQVLNSNYDLTSSNAPKRMYYNSLKGGFSDNCRL